MFQQISRAVLLLIILIFVIGCGEENTPPVLEAIPDVTLNIDTAADVEVIVTDTDDDTHSLRATSDNTSIATVSVNDTTITISTFVEGVTTITVTAEDDNAESPPVTFQVSVKANNSPVLEAIPDVTLTAGVRFEVTVNFTDADADDTHSILPTSSDTKIVEFSTRYRGDFPIVGDSVGTTTITVQVEDSSGVNNAKSNTVSFQVTVEPYIDLGLCVVGMTLEPGQSCTYFVDQTEVVFSVNDEYGCIQSRKADGTLGPVSLCAYPDIDRAGFRADKWGDRKWDIERLP